MVGGGVVGSQLEGVRGCLLIYSLIEEIDVDVSGLRKEVRACFLSSLVW